ncbi:DUF1922 domain-containing protein [Candidatus Bathyarchaeota archaeon]|nr:DUF1922 domain-containing protein [Candidatus Bathyarchaeota archaeon]
MEKVFGEAAAMTKAYVVVCIRCGGLLLAKENQKTRTCPYCGFGIVLFKARKLTSAQNVQEASEIMKKMKSSMPRKIR